MQSAITANHLYRITNLVSGESVAVRGLRSALAFLHTWDTLPGEFWKNKIDMVYLRRMASGGGGYRPKVKVDPRLYVKVERLNMSLLQFEQLPDHYLNVMDRLHPKPQPPASDSESESED